MRIDRLMDNNNSIGKRNGRSEPKGSLDAWCRDGMFHCCPVFNRIANWFRRKSRRDDL